MEIPCQSSIEPPGFVSHGVSLLNIHKRPSARPRRRWESDIRMDIKEKGIDTRNWPNSTQDRDYSRSLVNAALNLRIP